MHSNMIVSLKPFFYLHVLLIHVMLEMYFLNWVVTNASTLKLIVGFLSFRSTTIAHSLIVPETENLVVFLNIVIYKTN